jgi:copper chaperone CopZ
MVKDSQVVEEFKIKGMICSRCLKVLRNELKATGAKVIKIQLGTIVIEYDS